VTNEETENILKHKDLTTEIQPMWNMKDKVIGVITRATGTISKWFRQYFSNIM
jgi:DNA-directed RNA polymerase subunit H (RpoH/RPB5)